MTTNDVWISIALMLKQGFPGVKRHKERIKKISPPCFSAELLEQENGVFSEKIRKKRYVFDIIYYSEDNSVSSNFDVGDTLLSLFLPASRIGTRWVTILEDPELRYVGQDLHFIIVFEFFDDGEQVIYLKDPTSGEVVPVAPDTDVTNKENIIKSVDLMRELYVNLR